MPRRLLIAAVFAFGLAAPAVADLPAGASASDRLIFAPRDFSAAAAAPGIVWQMQRTGPLAEGFMPLSDGRLILDTITDPVDGKPMLQLREVGGGRERTVGRYPSQGVDPVLIYFFETATRNMAALGHGNPDYIRNRFKDALRRGGVVNPAPQGGQRVVLTPFSGDPNAARMGGFETLTLTLDIPDRPGAPIRALAAEAPGAGYALRLTETAAP